MEYHLKYNMYVIKTKGAEKRALKINYLTGCGKILSPQTNEG